MRGIYPFVILSHLIVETRRREQLLSVARHHPAEVEIGTVRAG